MTTPTPTLSPLTTGDGFLIADWINLPYVGINNAYLLVVNTSNYTDIQYIYLTESQALEQTYKISGLVNSTTYLVQYTQTMNAPDGIQGSSNTRTGTPLATPNAPSILTNNPLYPIVVDFDPSNNVFDIHLWVDYGTVPYVPALEQTIFKLVAENTSTISSVLFTVSNPLNRYVRYNFTNLTANTYAISCFNVNNNGVGPLSNVASVQVGALPFVTDVTRVVSGQNGQLTVTIDTPQNLTYNITEVDLYYSTDNTTWRVGGTIPSSAFNIVSGVIIATGVMTSGTYDASGALIPLVNGTAYYVKAVAVNSQGDGPSGTQGKGIPAIQSVVSAVTINNASTQGNLDASWSYVQGTFTAALLYNWVLTDVTDPSNNVVIISSSTPTTATSINLTGLSLTAGHYLVLTVTPIDTVPLSILNFWTYPPLTGSSSDLWVGTAVNSPQFQVNNRPNAPTNFVCSVAGNQILTYSWIQSSSSGYNAATSYTIRLLDSSSNQVGIATLLVSDPSFNSVYTFSGLTNNASYTASLYASNSYGNSSSVTTGPNQPLNPIVSASGLVGPIQGVPLSTGLYPLTTTWDAFSQAGYTLVNYTVNVYRVVAGGDVIDQSGNTLFTTYTYDEAAFGDSYYFGVIINAYRTQFGSGSTISSSETFGSTWEVAGYPFIDPSNVHFTTDASNNGIITFTVDNRGSELIGLMSFVPPSSGSPNPIQAPPTNYYPFQTGSGNKTYTANLGYPVNTPTPFLIYAVNSVGGSYIDAYLD